MDINQTEMRTWLHCRRRWFYEHFLRPEREDPVSGPLALGSAVHESLAYWYKGDADEVEIINGLDDQYQALMLENPTKPEIADDRDIAMPVLAGYFDWLAEEGADVGTKTIEVEKTLTAEILPDLTLHGTVDRVYEDHTGLVVVQDHKTVGQFDAADALSIDFQGLTYALLWKLNNPDARSVFEYNMLKKNKRTARAKPPFYRRERVRYSDEQLRSHWTHIQSIASDIKDARQMLSDGDDHHFHCPPNPGRDCTWKCSLGLSGCALLDDSGGTEFLVSLTSKTEV